MLRPLKTTLAFTLGLSLAACGPATKASENAEPKESQWQEGSGHERPEEYTAPNTHGPSAKGSPSATASSAPAVSDLHPREQAILDRHNMHRADHCAPPLQWSPKLAAVAQSWADSLKQAGCAFEHSKQSPYGENLSFFAPAGSSSPDDVATGWYNEVSAYDFTKGAFGFNTGHFTQVVWRGTQSVGCGQSECNGGELWVCNYDPPGNMSGAFGQNVRPTGCAGQ